MQLNPSEISELIKNRIQNMDAGGIALAILDGEAAPAGGMGIAKQLKDEIFNCPPVLVLTGRPMSADEAHRHGLVNRVTPSGEALAGARELAAEIVRRVVGSCGVPVTEPSTATETSGPVIVRSSLATRTVEVSQDGCE